MANCLVFNPFWENFELDLWPWTKVKVIDTWVIGCKLLGCTLVPSMKSVGKIASEIWPILCFFTHIGENLTLTFDLDQISTWVIECTLLGCTLVPSMKCVGEIASKVWPVICFFFYPFLAKFDIDLWPWPQVKVIGTWVIECVLLGCTLVPSMKSVGQIDMRYVNFRFKRFLWLILTLHKILHNENSYTLFFYHHT